MKVNGDQIVINIEDLLTDEVRIALCKQACFSELLAEFVCKMLKDGIVYWDDQPDDIHGWHMYRTGCPQAFEKARQEVAKHADEITKKLVSDLTKHRDELAQRLDETQSKLWKAENAYRELRAEIERERRERSEGR